MNVAPIIKTLGMAWLILLVASLAHAQAPADAPAPEAAPEPEPAADDAPPADANEDAQPTPTPPPLTPDQRRILQGKEMVMEPGQEILFDTAFNPSDKPYPAGCKLKGAAVGLSLVIVPFDCDGSEVSVRLRHIASEEERAIVETERFKISADEGTPATLVEDVAQRVRDMEYDIVWLQRKDVDLQVYVGPNQPVELLEAAEHAEAGRTDKAMSIILDLLRSSPGPGVASELIGLMVTTEIDPAKARDWIEQAKASPEDMAMLFASGVAAYLGADSSYNVTEKDRKELHTYVIDALNKSGEAIGRDMGFHKILAESYFVVGRQADAEANIARAFELDEHGPYLPLLLSRARIMQKVNPQAAADDVDQYLAALAEAAALNPDRAADQAEIERLPRLSGMLRSGDYSDVDLWFDTRHFRERKWYRMLDFPLIGVAVLVLGYLGIRAVRKK